MNSDNVVELLKQVLSRLSVIEGKINGNSETSDASGGAILPKSIISFDEYCATNLDPFLAVCTKLGGGALEAGKIIKDAWYEMRKILIIATACKEPPQAKISTLLASLSEKIKASSAAVKRNEWEKHCKTCSEGIGCLSWLVVKPAPRDFIESYIGGSDYWANGIRKEHKATGPDHIEFCNKFKTLLQELMVYVKEYHTTGLTWNKNGVDISEYNPDAASVATPSISRTQSKPVSSVAKEAPVVVAKADLFASLNREGAVTSGLKKVTKDMQTWRSEYKADDAPAVVAKAFVPKSSSSSSSEPAMKHPPKYEFQSASSKWVVEYQTAASGLVNVEVQDKKETIYIFGCFGANININGKCKSIVVDGCKKTNVTFSAAMASCEVVNCQRMNIICTEIVAAVAIDKTDGIVVTLPRTSLTTEVVASKSSEMNLSWPDENGDMIERPIPEQYVHRIKGLSVTANVSDLYH